MPETKASDPSTWAPTPTQEENDLAASGQHVADKEHDGSPITDTGGDPQSADQQREHKTRQVHAEQPARGGYQTRQARAAQQPSHPPPLAHPHSDE